jgi:hypothetical protein
MKGFFCLLLMVSLAVPTTAICEESEPAPDVSSMRVGDPLVICGTGFSRGDCRFATDILMLAIRDLQIEIPSWRWVIVPVQQWKTTAESFGVKPTVPAFSSFGVSTTYIEANLVVQDQRIDENLQSYTRLGGMGRLRWVIAHESGHIVCRTFDDSRAEAAGKKILAGNRKVCR